jgi:spermidine/putrescine transport system ATP-binding protein
VTDPQGPRTAAQIHLVDLVKRYGDVVAVDAITLDIPAGSFFALLGPSGCGKTSTLRMVAGLESPTGGRILLDGEDVTFRKPYRRPVNTVFQHYALFPHLTIFENVAFGLRRRRQRDVREPVEQMLELVALGGYGSRRPAQLSGGQQQRVALARALINRPKVLLLDEPLGALDLQLRRQMQLELKRIQDEVGTTFVHVTHDQEEAMSMADTIAVMNEGRVEQLGDPSSLYERPRTAFVAGFLGQSNLLDGRVIGTDGPYRSVRVADVTVRVPAEDVPPNAAAAVRVGVRPEKIGLVLAEGPEATAAGGENVLAATITDASYLGVSTQYEVETGWGQPLTVFVQNLRVDPSLRPGARVLLRWDPAHTFAVPAGRGTPEPATDTPAPVGQP